MSELEFLYSALHEEFGITVETEDVEALRQRLYALRRRLKDPELDRLSLKPSPLNPTGTLWIVKRNETS